MTTRYHDSDPFGFDRHVREALPMPVTAPADTPKLGPDSLIWKFYGDIRVQLFGFQRLAATENAIAELAQAVSDHSVIFGDFLGRATRTARPVLKTVYSEDPHTWGRTVRDFHTGIKGAMPDGARYHALNPELFYWAHATFLDQILYCTDTFVRRLTRAEQEQVFDEGKTWYQLYGVSARNQPATYDEFVDYWDSMLERFTSTKAVVYGTGYIRKGIPPLGPIPRPVWRLLSAPINAYTRTMITGTLPPQLRRVCGLDWSQQQENTFQRNAATIRALDPAFDHLPLRARYAPWAADGWERTGTNPRTVHRPHRNNHPGPR
ncbi:oxygenase MpaB family protein [Nocardia fusca]|uniref:Oxygenase MpaB family protein n=1 Tax=Nocardia fusca TaxID=941183 RepID=A0ABV3F475_9NOCA